MERDSVDFLAAFAAGALIGAAIGLALRPEPPTRRERLQRELAPFRKRIRRSARRARENLGRGAGAAADVGEELADAGRVVLGEFRKELSDMLSAARDDMGRTLAHQLDEARKAGRRAADRFERA